MCPVKVQEKKTKTIGLIGKLNNISSVNLCGLFEKKKIKKEVSIQTREAFQ